MKTRLRLALVAALIPLSLTQLSMSPAEAGPIERACMASDRPANRNLCGCIQTVADRTLQRGDQRKAAKFFRDPDLAHDTWMSQSARDDAFWDRYKAFGATAEASCS